MSPWSGGRYSVEPEVFIEIDVGILTVSPTPESMLTAQVNPNPFFGIVLQVRKGFGTVQVIDVVHPSPERHVESP